MNFNFNVFKILFQDTSSPGNASALKSNLKNPITKYMKLNF